MRRLWAWLLPKPVPDEDRIWGAIGDLALAVAIVTDSPPKEYSRNMGPLTVARILLDFYIIDCTWMREEIDAELFALEAVVAEETS